MTKNNRPPSVFFVTGVPKSGTTWVQMMLNCHHQIFCRPEDKFCGCLKGIAQLLDGYNRLIDQANQNTAHQKDMYLFDATDRIYCFKWLVTRALLKYSKAGKPVTHVGTKDNGIIGNPDIYVQSFPEAKFIGVLRNPKDVAVSSWFNNLRVEPNFTERSGGDLAVWAKKVVFTWGTHIKKMSSAFEDRPDQLLWVRYEDLLSDTTATVTAMLNFLNVRSDLAEIQNIIEENRFSNLSSGRKQGQEDPNHFFRKGISGDWKNHLAPDVWNEITIDVQDLMGHLLYE